MYRLHISKQLQSVLAHGVSLPGINTIAFARGQDTLPALPFEYLVGRCFGILFGQHLVKDSVPQAKPGVSEPGECETFHQLSEYVSAGDHDLASFRPDSRDTATLRGTHAGQLGSQTAHTLRIRHRLAPGAATPARGFSYCLAGLRKRSSSSRGCDDQRN